MESVGGSGAGLYGGFLSQLFGRYIQMGFWIYHPSRTIGLIPCMFC